METIGDWAANEFMAAWHRNSAILTQQPCVSSGQHLPWCIWQTVLSECKMDTWKGAVSTVSLLSNFHHPWCKYGIIKQYATVWIVHLMLVTWTRHIDVQHQCLAGYLVGSMVGSLLRLHDLAAPRCEHAMCQCRFLPGDARYLLGFGCWEVTQSAAGKEHFASHIWADLHSWILEEVETALFWRRLALSEAATLESYDFNSWKENSWTKCCVRRFKQIWNRYRNVHAETCVPWVRHSCSSKILLTLVNWVDIFFDGRMLCFPKKGKHSSRSLLLALCRAFWSGWRPVSAQSWCMLMCLAWFARRFWGVDPPLVRFFHPAMKATACPWPEYVWFPQGHFGIFHDKCMTWIWNLGGAFLRCTKGTQTHISKWSSVSLLTTRRPGIPWLTSTSVGAQCS